MNKEVWSCRFD